MRKEDDMEINIQALFFMFFGEQISSVKKKELKDLIVLCAKKAYKDFCRTMEYDGIGNNDKEEWKNCMVDMIAQHIYMLKHEEKCFDKWHEELCNMLIDASKKRNITFHFGQAQKWVNMTLKYLRMMGIDFGNAEKDMHIPVDSYIIEAAAEPLDSPLIDGMDVNGLEIYFHCDESNSKKAWSKCDNYTQYLKFQGKIRKANNNNQLKWEEEAWMAMAIKHAME